MTWLAAYLAGFIVVYAFRDQPWTYGRTQDVIVYLLLWWFFALVWVLVPRKWYRPDVLGG